MEMTGHKMELGRSSCLCVTILGVDIMVGCCTCHRTVYPIPQTNISLLLSIKAWYSTFLLFFKGDLVFDKRKMPEVINNLF